MTVRIVVTEPLDEAPLAWLAQHAEVLRITPDDAGFADALASGHGLIVRTYTQVDEAMLDMARCLKVVGRAGTGLDNIDLAACAARDIKVVHVPDANRQAVVEYVTSILAHVVRPLPPPVEAGLAYDAWAGLRRASIAPRQMSELTLGILGLGQIGRRVAQVAGAIGFDVIYTDLVEIPEHERFGARPASQADLLAQSDILTVHVDGRAENRGLLGAEAFEAMSGDALLINTSRGMVVQSAALAQVLAAKPAMRAVLDVHEVEPVPEDCALVRCAGALLLPHAASRTRAAQEAMSWVVRDVASELGLA